MTSSKQDMGVVPADDDLVERVALALYECDGGSRDQFQEETTTTRPAYYALARAALASLSSELARCRNALDIPALAEKCAVACRSEQFPSTATYETRIARVLNAALNPIGERE